MMNKKGHTTPGASQAELERVQRAVGQQLQRLARGRILPLPDEVAPRGWYRRFRQLLARGSNN